MSKCVVILCLLCSFAEASKRPRDNPSVEEAQYLDADCQQRPEAEGCEEPRRQFSSVLLQRKQVMKQDSVFADDTSSTSSRHGKKDCVDIAGAYKLFIKGQDTGELDHWYQDGCEARNDIVSRTFNISGSTIQDDGSGRTAPISVSPGNISFTLADNITFMSQACPAGFLHEIGHMPLDKQKGPGKIPPVLDQPIQTCSDCAKKCNATGPCRSYECSVTEKSCNLNTAFTHEKSTVPKKEYVFCHRKFCSYGCSRRQCKWSNASCDGCDFCEETEKQMEGDHARQELAIASYKQLKAMEDIEAATVVERKGWEKFAEVQRKIEESLAEVHRLRSEALAQEVAPFSVGEYSTKTCLAGYIRIGSHWDNAGYALCKLAVTWNNRPQGPNGTAWPQGWSKFGWTGDRPRGDRPRGCNAVDVAAGVDVFFNAQEGVQSNESRPICYKVSNYLGQGPCRNSNNNGNLIVGNWSESTVCKGLEECQQECQDDQDCMAISWAEFPQDDEDSCKSSGRPRCIQYRGQAVASITAIASGSESDGNSTMKEYACYGKPGERKASCKTYCEKIPTEWVEKCKWSGCKACDQCQDAAGADAKKKKEEEEVQCSMKCFPSKGGSCDSDGCDGCVWCQAISHCCDEHLAKCLACKARFTEEQYCRLNYGIPGCPEPCVFAPETPVERGPGWSGGPGGTLGTVTKVFKRGGGGWLRVNAAEFLFGYRKPITVPMVAEVTWSRSSKESYNYSLGSSANCELAKVCKLHVSDRVERGPDWRPEWRQSSLLGSVVEVKETGEVRVQWDHATAKYWYRCGMAGAYEVVLKGTAFAPTLSPYSCASEADVMFAGKSWYCSQGELHGKDARYIQETATTSGCHAACFGNPKCTHYTSGPSPRRVPPSQAVSGECRLYGECGNAASVDLYGPVVTCKIQRPENWCIDIAGDYSTKYNGKPAAKESLSQSACSGDSGAWKFTVSGATATIIGHPVTGKISGLPGSHKIVWSNGFIYTQEQVPT